MKIEALTKPYFSKPMGPDDLPPQLVTPEDSRLAEHMIAAYRSMRAEVVKTYTSMLLPLNKKRNVILAWKRDDVLEIDAAVERASTLLMDYRTRAALAREAKAEATLAKAHAEAQQCQDEEVEFLQTAADLATDTALADALISQAEAVRQAPPPMVAVIDDTLPEQTKADSPIIERKRYSVSCHDLMRLIQAVAAGRITPNALSPNQSWLNAQAEAMREEFDVPGCELQVKSSFARKATRS